MTEKSTMPYQWLSRWQKHPFHLWIKLSSVVGINNNTREVPETCSLNDYMIQIMNSSTQTSCWFTLLKTKKPPFSEGSHKFLGSHPHFEGEDDDHIKDYEKHLLCCVFFPLHFKKLSNKQNCLHHKHKAI